MLLGLLWQSCHAWITHRIACRVVIATDEPHYTWNYLSCATELHVMDRHGETNLTKILARSSQVPGNLARLTNVGLHSSISMLVVHTHQVPTFHTPSPTCRK